MSDLSLSVVPETELDTLLDLTGLVFHFPAGGQEFLRWRVSRAHRIGTYDEGRLVASLPALPISLSIPGGELACAALSAVAVLPTHRRRGVLTQMMQHLFDDARVANQPLAALWAHEGAVYGRYGFGIGTRGRQVRVDTRRPLELRLRPDTRTPRLLAPTEAPTALHVLYERSRNRRPGQVARDAEWWHQVHLLPTHPANPAATPPSIALIDGNPGGYALYRTHLPGGESGYVHLDELHADTPSVEAALWSYLAGIDLTDSIQCWSRPTDDTLHLLAADPDQATITKDFPALWLRLIDVKTSLERRSWATETTVVLDVRDDHIPENQQRWRLHTRPEGATCTPADTEPDLTLHVRDLASAYLATTPVTRLVAAALATEHTSGAAHRLDAALALPRASHTSDSF